MHGLQEARERKAEVKAKVWGPGNSESRWRKNGQKEASDEG